MTLTEILERKNQAIKDAQAISDPASTEGRALTAEEQTRFDAAWSDHDKWDVIYQRDSKVISAARIAELQAAEARESTGIIAGRQDNPGAEGEPGEERDQRTDEQVSMRAFNSLLAEGARDAQDRADMEARALQADSLEAGGFIIPPQEFVNQLIKAVDDIVHIRRLATIRMVTASGSLGVPALDADPADADWTAELLTGNADTAMDFGKRELEPHPLAKRILVSNKLLRLGAMDAESLVRERLAYKFGITQEKAFMTGTGAQQPLGVFVAATEGITTARDVSTGNSSTAFTVDGLIEAKYSMKGAYWPRSEWIFHRDAVKMLAKLKDGEGQYIWSESPRVGEPAQLLGMPMNTSEYAPNTFTTGLYVGILGDFSRYWIADSLAMNITRLVELYAATNQVGFIGRTELDGMPVLEEAFARVTLA